MRKPAAWAWLVGALLAPGALVWACGGALPGPKVCSERDPCAKGRTCVLGRCRKNKTMPISTNAERLDFTPVDFAWVDGSEAQGPDAIGDRIVLGKTGDERARLYLRFALRVPPAEKIQRALLTLEPLPVCARKPGRIAIELAHVLEPWRSAELGGGKRPRLDIPMRAATTSVTPPRPLRLDVTELVKAWREHPKRYHGLALMAAGTSPTGACFSSGVAGGRGPELSIFLWPEDAGAPTDAGVDGSDTSDAGDGDADTDDRRPTRRRSR